MNNNDLALTIGMALNACQAGKVIPELKKLQDVHLRDRVHWTLFPDWARPNSVFDDAGHEG